MTSEEFARLLNDGTETERARRVRELDEMVRAALGGPPMPALPRIVWPLLHDRKREKRENDGG